MAPATPLRLHRTSTGEQRQRSRGPRRPTRCHSRHPGTPSMEALHSKLSADGAPVADATQYRSLAGALQYLTFTRPDIAFAVQQICLYMHDPREPHLAALKRILRYLQGSLSLGLTMRRSPPAELVVYTDADWAGCPNTRRSTSGYTVFLGDNLVSWSSSVSKQSPGPVQRPSIVLWQMVLLKLLGSASCLPSFATRLIVPPWSIVITSVLFTSLAIRCSISGQSMLRLIFTLSGRRSPSVTFGYFMFRRHHSTPTSSPRAFLPRCFRSFDPA